MLRYASKETNYTLNSVRCTHFTHWTHHILYCALYSSVCLLVSLHFSSERPFVSCLPSFVIVSTWQRIYLFEVYINLMLIKIAGDLFLLLALYFVCVCVNQMFIESTYFIRCMEMTIIKWKSDKFLYRFCLLSAVAAVFTHFIPCVWVPLSFVLCINYWDSLFIYFDFEHSIFEWKKSQHTQYRHNVQNKIIKKCIAREKSVQTNALWIVVSHWLLITFNTIEEYGY